MLTQQISRCTLSIQHCLLLNGLASKPTEEHFGTLNLLPTIVELNGKQIVHGDIAVNMQSMTVSDIEDKESNAKLLGHLKNEDFFNVEKYPEAHLVVLESRVDPDQKYNDGRPYHKRNSNFC